MRILSLLIAAMLIFFSQMALGAQNSQFTPIGYSPEGRFFAYEEFGLIGARAKGYSKIYVVDLFEVTQVVGTPIIYQANSNEQTLAFIRNQARQNAEAILQSLEINHPATIAAMIGDGQPYIANDQLNFSAAGVQNLQNLPDLQRIYELRLKTFETEAASECAEFRNIMTKGFSLFLRALAPGSAETAPMSIRDEIFRDEVLPRSRSCPFGYGIAAIIQPFGAKNIVGSVALISVVIENRDGIARNYLAIPLTAKPLEAE